jgi:hypothetical protein
MVGVPTNHQLTAWLLSLVAMVGVLGRHGWCPHQPSINSMPAANVMILRRFLGEI